MKAAGSSRRYPPRALASGRPTRTTATPRRPAPRWLLRTSPGAVAALWSYDPTLIGQVEQTRRLLAESAVDVDDTECGGTAAFNNKYGEGRLDLVRLLQLAPRQGGTLTGVVTADGAPVPGAEVTVSGPFSRSIGTDKDGRFTMNLPVGDYQISTKVFGYLSATARVTITLGQDTSVELPLTVAPRHDISGRVVDDQKQPVPNADVSVKDTPLDPVRTDANGAFTISDVPEGAYQLNVKPNACFSPTTVPLTVGAQNESPEIQVALVVDEGGYSCSVSEGEYLRGTDPVAFPSGVWATVKLPFPVALYNGGHDTLGIGLRGVISPDTTTGPGSGGAGVFPFWVPSPVEFAPAGESSPRPPRSTAMTPSSSNTAMPGSGPTRSGRSTASRSTSRPRSPARAR